MRDVIRRYLQYLFEGERTALVVNALPLQGRLGQLAQDADHLPARQVKDGQFLFQIAVLIGQGGSKAVLVGPEQGRLFFGNDPFHAVGHDRVEIDQMAHNFHRAPFARHRLGQDLLCASCRPRPAAKSLRQQDILRSFVLVPCMDSCGNLVIGH